MSFLLRSTMEVEIGSQLSKVSAQTSKLGCAGDVPGLYIREGISGLPASAFLPR